jgi:hypothetical protein
MVVSIFTQLLKCLPTSFIKTDDVHRIVVIKNFARGTVPTALGFHTRPRNHGLKPVATVGIVPSGTVACCAPSRLWW